MFFENRVTPCWFWKKTGKPKKAGTKRIKIGVSRSFATELKHILHLIREFGLRDLESQRGSSNRERVNLDLRLKQPVHHRKDCLLRR